MFKDILIAIPVFNEKKNIKKVLIEVQKKFKNIAVIDNCSTDGTNKIIQQFNVTNIKHDYNLGKSLSMKTALDYALIKKYKYIAYIDGDGQHNVDDLVKISSEIKDNRLDAVIGYRCQLNKLNLKKRIGTKVLEFFFYILFKKKIYDIQSGLRVLKVSILKKINIKSKGSRHYFADAEITCKLVKMNKKIKQIPIKTIRSESYKGMNIVQGIYLMFNLLFWRISSNWS